VAFHLGPGEKLLRYGKLATSSLFFKGILGSFTTLCWWKLVDIAETRSYVEALSFQADHRE
jgi:hypothetical protein